MSPWKNSRSTTSNWQCSAGVRSKLLACPTKSLAIITKLAGEQGLACRRRFKSSMTRGHCCTPPGRTNFTHKPSTASSTLPSCMSWVLVPFAAHARTLASQICSISSRNATSTCGSACSAFCFWPMLLKWFLIELSEIVAFKSVNKVAFVAFFTRGSVRSARRATWTTCVKASKTSVWYVVVVSSAWTALEVTPGSNASLATTCGKKGNLHSGASLNCERRKSATCFMSSSRSASSKNSKKHRTLSGGNSDDVATLAKMLPTMSRWQCPFRHAKWYNSNGSGTCNSTILLRPAI
mmetsp:Transcript_29928/g.90578  ORF Transcript_29928/g.90578 Transcript_29928/m.90578 type:complete len:294 (+) Transcript_29928:1046-1927(+)